MKAQSKFLNSKIIIPILSIFIIAPIVYFLFLRSPVVQEEMSEQYSVPEHLIDSVLNNMSDSSKIGLLLFVEAEVIDNSQFSEMLHIGRRYQINSWLTDVLSFDYHKLISDSLQLFQNIPLTYAIRWDKATSDAGQLPPFPRFTSFSDSVFSDKFAKHYAGLLSEHGINCIVFPQLFDTLLDEAPPLDYINNLISTIQSTFPATYFLPQQLVFSSGKTTIASVDSTIAFPGDDLTNIFIQSYGYSACGNINQSILSHSFNIGRYEEEADILSFFNSPYNMLFVKQNQVETVYHVLMKNFSKYSEQTNKKLKQIISAKLYQFSQPKNESLPLVKASSTAWKTILMQISEHIACFSKNTDQLFPLRHGKAKFIVAKGCQLPFFHNALKAFDDAYTYSIIETDIASTSAVVKNTTMGKEPLIFIQNGWHPFHFDSLSLQNIKDSKMAALIDFSEGKHFETHDWFSSVIIAGSDLPVFQTTIAALITGSTNVSGRYNNYSLSKTGESSIQIFITRLKQSFPEDANLDGEYLQASIDSIVLGAIAKGAFPGCQVFGAKDGKIIFNQSYGWHSYDKAQAVKTTDLYDVASVTKIAATTVAAMLMCDQGRLQLNQVMKRYFKNTVINYSRIKPDTNVVVDTVNLNMISLQKLIREKKLPKDTFRVKDSLLVCIDSVFSKATPSLNIFNVPIRYMLMHYSGISPTLPILPFIQIRKYYLKEHGLVETDSAAKNISWKEVWNLYYVNKRTDSSTVQIADAIYLKNRWLDTLWQRTKEVGVSGRKYSQYTDLNMILVQLTIDTINKMNIDKYLKREIYGPLGLKNIMFLPLNHGVSRQRIAPTEYDKSWRQQVLRGHVHDPSAAMLGGISGNAGLFSSAEDLGVLFQMLLNDGVYGGKRYLSQQIIRLFTATNSETGRGLGFDKYSPRNIVAPSASVNTYGHTGFTGCCVWVDPDSKLVFVFLSNRVHPNGNNQRINGLKVRQNVHQTFYDAELSKQTNNHNN